MTKTRNAKKRIAIVSPAQFEEAMERFVAAERREAEINKCMETEVNDVLHSYEEELSCLRQGKNSAFEIVQNYCVANKERLFANRRSIATMHGMAGFRLGTPRLKPVSGENWNTIVTRLREKLPDYVRTTWEPAKDLLLADRQTEKVAPVLVDIGIEVVQDELFYLEPKKAA